MIWIAITDLFLLLYLPGLIIFICYANSLSSIKIACFSASSEDLAAERRLAKSKSSWGHFRGVNHIYNYKQVDLLVLYLDL